MKKILAGLMVILVLFAAPISAYAYSGYSKVRANELNQAGLLNGYGINKYGRVEYGLDDTVTRAQAVGEMKL